MLQPVGLRMEKGSWILFVSTAQFFTHFQYIRIWGIKGCNVEGTTSVKHTTVSRPFVCAKTCVTGDEAAWMWSAPTSAMQAACYICCFNQSSETVCSPMLEGRLYSSASLCIAHDLAWAWRSWKLNCRHWRPRRQLDLSSAEVDPPRRALSAAR